MFLNYLIKRLFSAAFVLLGITTLVFLLIHLVPGDPVEVMLGETARSADREALRQALGLDLPVLQQWWQYLMGIAHFDLGESLHSKRAVSQLLIERLPATAILSIASMLIAIIIALPLGIMAAVYKDSIWDRLAMMTAMLGVSIPNFVMGPLLILIFALWLGWFPVSGKEGFASLILPALTLGTALAAILSRMVRASMLEVLQEDYIRAARARGLTECHVLGLHALRNAALPVITILGMQFGALLAGAVITETIFAWPGIGQLMIESIQKRDYPIVQACVLLISFTYVLVNLLTDILYTTLDPRVKLD
ncbi:MAG: ABC transporter permease [Proteobacteria bacterium]|nr:ABC transporter permease [Pseudomonadota bacterium]NOG60174.1 ABC transporter permease [Pseudomonadota bacterium]